MRQGVMDITHEKKPISLTFLLKGVFGYSLAAVLAVGAVASFAQLDTTLAQAAGAIGGALLGAIIVLRG
jgi:hypothetical protein